MNTPLGYCLADITIHDPEAYKLYMARSGPAVEAAGGRYLVRGGSPEVLEGERAVSRVALLEFPSVAQARAFYESGQYQEALPFRQRAASCHFSLLTGNDPANTAQRKSGGGKGYVWAEMHPTDLEKYMEYPKLSTPIVAQFGGTFVVRGGAPHVLEGDRAPGRVVVVEFESPERARAFYHSPEYQEALKWRQRYSESHLCLLAGP